MPDSTSKTPAAIKTARPGRTRNRMALKVVAPDDDERRHPFAIEFPGANSWSGTDYLMGEIFSFAEWDALPAHSRPPGAVLVPGVGWIFATMTDSLKGGSHAWVEFQHVKELAKAERETRGYD
jgi:hypothetical protein